MKRMSKIFFSFAALLFAMNAYASEDINALFHNGKDPMIGNPKGSITIAEFFDYQCAACVYMGPVIKEAVRKNPNIRVVYKDFPIRGMSSAIAAKAALAANKQGKYREFNHALLMAEQPLTKDYIMGVAQKLGLNMKKFESDMNSSEVKNQLIANIQLANKLNLSGTPAFYIGRTNAKSNDEIDLEIGGFSQADLQKVINSISQK